MREIKIKIRIDEKNGGIAIVEEFDNMFKDLDRLIYLIGIYQYLVNLQFSKLKAVERFSLNKDE